VSVDVSLKPKRAFDGLVDELSLGLGARGMEISKLARGGRITEGGAEVGVIDEWVPGRRISIQWRPKTWVEGAPGRLTIVLARTRGGTEITVESKNWGSVFGDDSQELLGWFAGEVTAPFLSVMAPRRLGDWITDRHARRPSGANARKTYSNPTYHWPNFLAILEVLNLRPDDNLLEVGCGGGAFLHEALKSGCRASAIDHSPDMVRLAAKTNSGSIARRRLKVEVGAAGDLPYPSGTFTCAVMTGVLIFIPDAARAFREVFRALRSGGRFVAFTSTKEMRGTPAAPEPMASRLHFYRDDELEGLARRAGFDEVKVEHPSLLQFAKRAAVPKSDLSMFKPTSGSQLLVCRKS
jgi:SAM-dependent methyltransferase